MKAIVPSPFPYHVDQQMALQILPLDSCCRNKDLRHSLLNVQQINDCAAGGGVISERWRGEGAHAGAAASAQLWAQALCAGAVRAASRRPGRAPAALSASALVWEASPAAIRTSRVTRRCWLCYS